MPQRLEALTAWVKDLLHEKLCDAVESADALPADFQITTASADASFRRYFRVSGSGISTCFDAPGDSLIVMDAPPDKENLQPFVAVSNLLDNIGLHVPRVLAQNTAQGFLLLSDLGTQSYLDALNDQTVDSLYADALAALLVMQRDVPHEYLYGPQSLPAYDATLLLNEMALFRDWYCRQYRQLVFSDEQQTGLDQVFQRLSEAALAQPRVFVHRDYHSRNLMVTPQQNPGILDFQDAVVGPVTYDLVSLLRDCYIDWPRSRVEQWALGYLHDVAGAGLIPHESDETYLRWFDWMGIQRHLKATGIFARLCLRDGKSGYLDDIPRTLNYVREVSAGYPELRALHALVSELLE